MARSKEFNPTDALDKAIHLFWRQGYNATSVGDLVEATGVQRYGLYGTFGDKHTLFLRALDQYQEQYIGAMLALLDSAEADWTNINTFFDELFAASTEPPGTFGCLMVNSATELAKHDVQVANRMAIYETKAADLFERAIARAQQSGQLGLQLEPSDGAMVLLGMTVGVSALAKTPLPRQKLADYIRTGLAGIEALARG